MGQIGKKERETQDRVIALFRDVLKYDYLGNWEDRINSNVDEELLAAWLKKQGVDQNLINKALYEFTKATNSQGNLYYTNKDVYSLLRYGVTVQPEIGQNKTTVWLIDWKNPLNNHFAIAEEVTVVGQHTKRPDIVLYINGIALGVLELKRSSVSVTEGIRQNLDNQKDIFIKPFFTTMQFVLAGNDFEGISYGTVETKEKYYLKWKEVNEQYNKNDVYLLSITKPIRDLAAKFDYLLDKNIIEMLNKERFIELVRDFMVYDKGVKKICRPNQYFGVKASQDYVKRREGGIIWHTQGSGKSLTMVWLSKWIRENIQNSRVLIITDREELDEQIEKVYTGVSEKIYRSTSGGDLLEKLNDTSPWLMCSLVHKFGGKEEDEADVDAYIEELKKSIPTDYKAKGDIYVFVDECHRTQSGKLHEAMKQFLPNALFIGFTGTPLLKNDKQTSLEVFGKYIHTYKFDEAVNDKVVLDLRYEARDVEQKITSLDRIDEWFDLKTRGLTDFAKTELKQKWGTIKKVFSSKSRLEKIVMDVMLDMERKERLQNGNGNAILISDSIYNACRYYELFQQAGLKKCAIITSFVPNYNDIKGEDSGEGYTEKLHRFEIYKKMLSEYFNEDAEKALKKIEVFEKEVKAKFIEEPGQMKLLIVVNKLLTGFDAPPATYLYIDKKLKDHGLFQAVCRVNRLDGDDKEYGYIVDYMDLFDSLKHAFNDYTSGAFDGYEKSDVEGLLKDRLKKGKEQLDDALEAIKALCEAVDPPKNDIAYIRYFCGDTQNPEEVKDTEPRRVSLYKLTISLIRAYAGIVDELKEAGYTDKEAEQIRKDIVFFKDLRKQVQIISGDYVDLKQYEPAMRYLIDSYIGAEESKTLANFDDLSLVELLVEKGEEGINDFPDNIKKNKETMAEAIENNLRKVIIEERPTNPIYYEKMSVLLDELIKARKEATLQYAKYLKDIIELTKKVKKPDVTPRPSKIDTEAKRNLYDNLDKNEMLVLELDEKIRTTKKDQWRDNKFKLKEVELAVKQVLEKYDIVDEEQVKTIFGIVQKQRDY